MAITYLPGITIYEVVPLGGLTNQVLTKASNANYDLVWGAGGGASIGGDIVGGTTGSVLFVGAGPVLAQDNANFFWDHTNKTFLLSADVGQVTPLLKINDSSANTIVSLKPSIGGGSLTDNYLNISATFPSTLTATTTAVNIGVTSAGSSSFINEAVFIQFKAGYTGSSGTAAYDCLNQAAGTGTNAWGASVTANIGGSGRVQATTTGNNIGMRGRAANSSSLNIGMLGTADSATNSPAVNVGVVGNALNGTLNVGGYFSLSATAPTFASAALIADNGAISSPIFLGRTNGTIVVTIDSSGRFGVGITTPNYPIQLNSGLLAIPNTLFGSGVSSGLITVDGSNNKLLFFGSTDAGGTTYSFFRTNRGYDGSVNVTSGYLSTRPGASLQLEDDNFVFYQFAASSSSSAEKMRIDSNGSMGLGTSLPVSKFHILNPSPTTVSAIIQNASGQTYDSLQIKNNAGGVMSSFDSGGNLLVGTTTSPGTGLTVATPNGGANTSLNLVQLANGSAPNSYISIGFTVPTSGLIGQFLATADNYVNAAVDLGADSFVLSCQSTSGDLFLGANGSGGTIKFLTGGYAVANRRMTILPSGLVGIGTTTPRVRADILDTATQLRLTYTDNSVYTDFRTNSSGNLVITPSSGTVAIDGFLGVGATATPSTFSPIQLVSSNTSRVSIEVQNTSPSGNSSFYFQNDRGSFATYGGLLTGGSTDGGSNLFGLTRADKTFLIADGSSSLGLGIGTLTSQPFVLGTNNTAIMTILGSGNIEIQKLISKYNAVSTAGLGIPAIYGQGRATAQVAANASVATYTVGSADGSFMVSGNVNVTAFAVGTFNVTVTYTDETNTSQTLKMNFSSLTGTIGIAIAATGPFEGIPAHIRCKAATAITVATSGTFTSLTYNVEGYITQIG